VEALPSGHGSHPARAVWLFSAINGIADRVNSRRSRKDTLRRSIVAESGEQFERLCGTTAAKAFDLTAWRLA
jgi:hypothetical protein